MTQHYHLYKSVTADTSQICDGRTAESLTKLIVDGDGAMLHAKDSSALSDTISGYGADAEIKSHCGAFKSYRPVSLSKPGGLKTEPHKAKKTLTDAPDDLDVSPDDVNAISKIADWFQNNLDLSRHPPKMPFDEGQKHAAPKNALTSGEKPCIDAVESSPPRRSYLRSASLLTETDPSLSLPSPVGQQHKHSPSRDARKTQPHITCYYTPPSKTRMRKKSTPQHRSPQVNESVSSILKMPKYSRKLSLDLESEMESKDMQRRRRSAPNISRSESMPPIGPLPDLFFNSRKYSYTSDSNTSNESRNDNSDEWVPKGVDFEPNCEVYVFRKK